MNTFRDEREDGTDGREIFAKGLGLFGIGLGLAEIFAPRQWARLIGVKSRPALFTALGGREILSGVGILAQRRPAGWLWSRVAGDVMDLALLGVAFASEDSEETKVEAAAGAVAGVMILDVICAVQHSRETGPIRVEVLARFHESATLHAASSFRSRHR